MDRALRRDTTRRKYISRIKERLYYIVILDGYKISRNGVKLYNRRKPHDWKDAEEHCPWIKRLKHNKIYGRSTMNVLEKHSKVKKLRSESRRLISSIEDY